MSFFFGLTKKKNLPQKSTSEPLLTNQGKNIKKPVPSIELIFVIFVNFQIFKYHYNTILPNRNSQMVVRKFLCNLFSAFE